MRPHVRRRFITAALLLLGCSACTTPSSRLDEEALGLGLTRQVVRGQDFQHVVYTKPATKTSATVHVYIEGDGSPLLARRWVPPDPTPHRPIMLRLMAQDPSPSLYLGRPCYHGIEWAPTCDAWWWTLGRYSEEVVNSMVQALLAIRATYKHASFVLIGHSGGGALAMLIAERMPGTRAVVTLAGNLDIKAWAVYHDFTRLGGSLNPADRPPLNMRIAQIHLLAGRDRRVPPALTEPVIARQTGARTQVYPEFDHSCCWSTVWPSVLEELSAALN